MSIDFLAGGGDYDNEPMYVIELRKRIAELEADKAWLQEELRKLNKENLRLQANE